ncbi:16S rRNA (cytidine(1402)-2'-O)-methyltransferase [Porphyromonas sp.]|uniref:16S rRNA (cytidine(1402)-2'-O)-methyltransferase n=1 Tax=Porphyromonas sp. TaxID=1924944 RepID=UPI0026DC5B06|nr:16S rRNA (cytidine(1402)-2'-O)-methyltransferase [Porphyromonas sp.]MDO4771222.1 16S rRNA (cytidine(1402)-2'-O)-methyltransferase [Porphyromonas sp.]
MNPLIIIPTPIGNLEDITLRALRCMREADLIVAEDTRTTQRLLKAYEISTPVRSYHMHNEHSVAAGIVQQILLGHKIALVSDAGTPGISDPGFYLVRECVEAGIEVVCLPGATALIPALVGSGLPCDKFYFEGFLPHKKGRKSRIEAIATRDVTTILYEAPTRLIKLLEQVRESVGNEREIVVVRELTKIHEEYVRGTADQLLTHFEAKPPLGEIVVIIAPKEKEISQHTNKYQHLK